MLQGVFLWNAIKDRSIYAVERFTILHEIHQKDMIFRINNQNLSVIV